MKIKRTFILIVIGLCLLAIYMLTRPKTDNIFDEMYDHLLYSREGKFSYFYRNNAVFGGKISPEFTDMKDSQILYFTITKSTTEKMLIKYFYKYNQKKKDLSVHCSIIREDDSSQLSKLEQQNIAKSLGITEEYMEQEAKKILNSQIIEYWLQEYKSQFSIRDIGDLKIEKTTYF